MAMDHKSKPNPMDQWRDHLESKGGWDLYNK